MSLYSDLRHRIASLVLWNRRSRELREEIETHLRMETEHNLARGMEPAEARRRALIKLGGVERTRARVDDATGAAPMHDLVVDLGYALRGIRRRPSYWAALFLTLSTGLALTTMVFAFADAYLLRPLPYPKGDRLVALYDAPVPGQRGAASFAEFLRWREDLRQITPVVAYLGSGAGWSDGTSAFRVHVMLASRGYLQLLGIPLVAGRAFQDDEHTLDGPPVVVVSRAFAEAHLGGPKAAVGSTVTLDGRAFTVVGVATSGRDVADAAVDVWRPLEASARWRVPGAYFLHVIGRLAPGATHAGALAELAALPDDGTSRTGTAAPLRHALAGRASGPLRLLLLGALCVLFVSISNAAGLVYARSEARQADFTMRRALGARVGRLVRQAAAEFLLIAVTAAMFSAAIAVVGTSQVRRAWAPRYQNVLSVGLDGRAFILLGLLVFVSVLVMAAPVFWRLQRPGALPGAAASRSVGTRRRLWAALVGAQVALTTLLLVGGGLSGRSLRRVLAVDAGYDPSDAYSALFVLPREVYRTPAAQLDAFDQLLTHLRSTPGVEAAGGAVNLPLSGGAMSSTFEIEGDSRAEEDRAHTMAEQHIVTPGYLSAMHLRLVEGRDLDADDRVGATRVVLINQSMARRYWPGESPLGRRMRIVGTSYQTIVGVVADTRLDGLDRPSRLETYSPFAQHPLHYLSAVIRMPGGLRRAREAFAEARRQVSPLIPEETAQPVQDLLDHSTQGRRIPAASFGMFSVLALLLAAVGLFGLQAFAVAQRRREIGVRVALGATRANILRMVGGASLLIVGAGSLIGLALAALLARLAEGYLYGIEAWDPPTYLGVVALVAAAAVAATALPAMRAARVDPVVALQSE